jgi:NAD(P)-dependent dehydrogenase (short-subunit alcohol dehydrogenase family)
MTDTVWLITGSSRGLGRKIAEAALSRGDKVAATARDTTALAALVSAYPEQALALVLDVTDDDQVQAAVAAAHEHFGRLDIIVNNAGYANFSAVEDTPLADFRAQLDTNLTGTIAVTKAALPILREQKQGHIINVSSVGSRLATPGLAPYQAAKWAVSGFSEVLAAEVAPLGIRVTAIEPGGMPTDWAGSSMAFPAPSEPYQATVGAIGGFLTSGKLVALADLDKVAQAVLTLADTAEPPTRLLIGSDASNVARGYAAALAASDAKWQELTSSTDRDDATEADKDPLGQAAGS